MDGERIDNLSLTECENFDPAPVKSGGRLRFHCPRHGGDRQQSLSIDPATGKFSCFSCGIWGTLTEHRQDRPWRPSERTERPLPDPEPIEPHKYALKRALEAVKAFDGSPAQDYARRRGVPDNLAAGLHLGYWRGKWGGEDSEWLTFPLVDPVGGRPTGVFGRNLHSDEGDRKGRKLGSGVAGAHGPGALPADVLITEGPFDALELQASGYTTARALCGSAARPEWFDGCQRVTLLLDDDQAGRKAADRLVAAINERRQRRGSGPRVLDIQAGILRERYNCKDLGELLSRGQKVTLALPPLPELPAPPAADEPGEAAIPTPDAPADPSPDPEPAHQASPTPDNWREAVKGTTGTPAAEWLHAHGCNLQQANGYGARYHPALILAPIPCPRQAVIFPVRNNVATVAAVGFYLDDGRPLAAGGPVDPELLRSALPASLVALWDAPPLASTADQATKSEPAPEQETAASSPDQAQDPEQETATVRSWPPDLSPLADWFSKSMDEGTLPSDTAEGWYVHLGLMIDQGPTGANAHRLRTELEKLREMVNTTRALPIDGTPARILPLKGA